MFAELETELLEELAAQLSDALQESGNNEVNEDSTEQVLETYIAEADHDDDLPKRLPGQERKRVVVESYIKLGDRKLEINLLLSKTYRTFQTRLQAALNIVKLVS